MISIIRFFEGYYEIAVACRSSNAVLNRMFSYNVVYSGLKKHENGDISFLISTANYKRLEKLCDNICEDIHIVSKKGLPSLIYRYRKRVGLALGAIIFIALLFLSDSFVWKINISGNEKLSDKDILEALERLDFKTGSYIPSVDFYQLCAEMLIECKDASWISVNMKGTVADVIVKETQHKPEREYIQSDDVPSNLIATADGVIERAEIFSGKPEVEIGEQVKKGQLLVSGILDIGNDGEFRFVRSSGSVYARVKRLFTVDIPLKYEKKVYTGNYYIEKSIIFLGNEIKIGKEYRLLGQLCDTIYNKEYIDVFGICEIPVMISTATSNEYRLEETELTKESAYILALAEMAKLTSSELYSSEILSSVTETYVMNINGEAVFRMVREIDCICDIASEQQIALS